VTERAGLAWPDAHSVQSLHRDLPDERHVSHFEFRSFDRNGHLKVLIHVLEWPDAQLELTGRANRTAPALAKHWSEALQN
jgi:hypothetical protein